MSETPHEKPEPPDKCPRVEIVRESDKEQHAQAMGDAELCEFITNALSPVKKILRDNLAYIAEARKRFAQPGRRVPVPGKPTWGNWIERNLGISDRHVRRLLAGQHEPQKRPNKKPEPRVEVESAGIILGNKGLEMARKLRDGDVDEAKRIAAEMLEADLDCPDGLLPPPVPEHMKTLGKRDIATLASLWRQAFDPLTHAQRRDMLIWFFGLIPGEHIADVTAAIERAPIHMGCASAAGKAKKRAGGRSQKPPASVKVTVCPPVQGPEEECEHGTLGAASGHPGRRLCNFIQDEKGKYEYEPEMGISEAEESLHAQPGGQPLPPGKLMAAVRIPGQGDRDFEVIPIRIPKLI